MFTENLSLLPSSQTQQAIREFQVRRPQPMREKLAQYPGASFLYDLKYGDLPPENLIGGEQSELGRNRLGSTRNTLELRTLETPSFPELVESRLDLSPGYVKQIASYSMLPD